MALLAPYAHVLRDLRDGCGTLLNEDVRWTDDPLLRSMLHRNTQSLQETRTLAELLLKEAQRINLVQRILEVNEDVLGEYRFQRFGEQGSVALFWGVIGLVARWLAVAVEDLTAVVLAHELAHAYTHLGLDIDGLRWPALEFSTADLPVVEGLAQYYTFRVLSRLQAGPGPLDAYQRLLANQPPDYRVHEPWVRNLTPEIIRAAMLQVRRSTVASSGALAQALGEASQRLKKRQS